MTIYYRKEGKLTVLLVIPTLDCKLGILWFTSDPTSYYNFLGLVQDAEWTKKHLQWYCLSITGELTGDFSCSWRHISKKESDLSTDFLALFLPPSPEMVSPSEMHWNQSGWMARWMSMNLEAVISMRPELPHRETVCTGRTGINSSCKWQQILRVREGIGRVKHQLLEW